MESISRMREEKTAAVRLALALQAINASACKDKLKKVTKGVTNVHAKCVCVYSSDRERARKESKRAKVQRKI